MERYCFGNKFLIKKNLEHCNSKYNVQGINKSTPKTYLMF